MHSAAMSRYKAVLFFMVFACVMWIVLLYNFLTATSYNRDSFLILPFPDHFRLDGNLTVPVCACTWKKDSGLIPCVYRTGKQMQTTNGSRLHLAVVACGERSGEALVLIKSAVALTTSFIVFYIFTDTKQHSFFVKEFKSWPSAYLERVELRLYPDTYPDMQNWKHKFAPCASQRLLFPSLLRDVDALVYVDADAVLLSPLDKMWNYFSRFNSTQMLALVPEHEDPTVSWYHQSSKIPYFGPFGLNSGVILMNLTRLRQVNWSSTLVQYHQVYEKNIVFFDQDLINIYCHFHPERLYVMDCSMNYRVDHCESRESTSGSVCKSAEWNGAYLLHGSKRSFKNVPSFKAVYRAFEKYKLGDNLLSGLLEPLQGELFKIRENHRKKSSCDHLPMIFLRHFMMR
ncbi:glucoside xylosyltransferase 2-like isoform X1 [Littorina saxatilis]|uniref:UDP-D-xylose:beta-D-glucoside alpha-1,3-D-xylosyltransferase n=1 Tax=Littorina saxatilis TaxID=31220 RepID=A0AAN9GE12_9CAEN